MDNYIDADGNLTKKAQDLALDLAMLDNKADIEKAQKNIESDLNKEGLNSDQVERIIKEMKAFADDAIAI